MQESNHNTGRLKQSNYGGQTGKRRLFMKNWKGSGAEFAEHWRHSISTYAPKWQKLYPSPIVRTCTLATTLYCVRTLTHLTPPFLAGMFLNIQAIIPQGKKTVKHFRDRKIIISYLLYNSTESRRQRKQSMIKASCI